MTGYFRDTGYYAVRNDQQRTMLLLGITTLCSVVATVLFLLPARQQAAASTPKELLLPAQLKSIEVLVAKRDIEPNALLEPAMFRNEERALDSLMPGTLTDYEALKGQFAKTKILANHPLQADYLTPTRSLNPVMQQIPKGYRAVAIRVDKITSVEGWIEPGSIVDVAWIADLAGKRSLVPLVENVRVLSLEQSTNVKSSPGSSAPTTVTLLARSRDVHRIQLASSSGSLSLSLRGTDDVESDGSTAISLGDLIPGSASKIQDPGYVGKIIVDGKEHWITRRGDFVADKEK